MRQMIVWAYLLNTRNAIAENVLLRTVRGASLMEDKTTERVTSQNAHWLKLNDAMSVTQDHLTCRRSVRLCPSVVDYGTRRRSVVNHFLNGVYSPTLSYRLQLCVFKKRDMPCRCWSRHRSKVFRDNNLIHITRKRTHNWHRQTDRQTERQTDSRRSHVALYNRNTVAVNNVIKYVHMNTTRRRASIPPSDWRYFHQIFTMFFCIFFFNFSVALLFLWKQLDHHEWGRVH